LKSFLYKLVVVPRTSIFEREQNILKMRLLSYLIIFRYMFWHKMNSSEEVIHTSGYNIVFGGENLWILLENCLICVQLCGSELCNVVLMMFLINQTGRSWELLLDLKSETVLMKSIFDSYHKRAMIEDKYLEG